VKQDPAELADYVRQVPTSQYDKMFKDSLTAEHLGSFVTALAEGFMPQGDAAGAVSVLQALTSVPRFGMGVMLMSRAHKQSLGGVFDKLAATAPLPGPELASLRKSFKV